MKAFPKTHREVKGYTTTLLFIPPYNFQAACKHHKVFDQPALFQDTHFTKTEKGSKGVSEGEIMRLAKGRNVEHGLYDNKLANQSSEIQTSTGFIVFLYITDMVTRTKKLPGKKISGWKERMSLQ